jgi:hypothetical protein
VQESNAVECNYREGWHGGEQECEGRNTGPNVCGWNEALEVVEIGVEQAVLNVFEVVLGCS